MEDPSSKQGAMSRRDSLAISALLNDVAVDPYRSPDWEQTRHHHRGGSHDYFSSRPNSGLMSSSVPSSPGGPRRERDALYVPEPQKEQQRPTTSWDPSTSVTPEGYHRRKTSKGNIIVSSIAKAKRKRISQEQFQRLMEVFEQTDTPSSEVRENLAQELGMTKREVQVWFQNRRAKMSRQRASTNGGSTTTATKTRSSSVRPLSSTQTPHQPLGNVPNIALYPAAAPPPQQQHRNTGATPSSQHQQNPYMMHPIAPMPSYPPHAVARDLSPTKRSYAPHHRSSLAPNQRNYLQQPEFDYFNYGGINRRPSSIHQSMANLSLQGDRNEEAPPARKRAKSAIDVLASAAEYVGNDDPKSERAPVR